jgi:hypothetical protein
LSNLYIKLSENGISPRPPFPSEVIGKYLWIRALPKFCRHFERSGFFILFARPYGLAFLMSFKTTNSPLGNIFIAFACRPVRSGSRQDPPSTSPKPSSPAPPSRSPPSSLVACWLLPNESVRRGACRRVVAP